MKGVRKAEYEKYVKGEKLERMSKVENGRDPNCVFVGEKEGIEVPLTEPRVVKIPKKTQKLAKNFNFELSGDFHNVIERSTQVTSSVQR